MTQDEMLKMAKQAGWQYAHNDSGYEPLWEFAKLVAAKERESCAKVCDVLAYHPEFASDATKLAAMAIRARGQA
jgi:hypothetical protein